MGLKVNNRPQGQGLSESNWKDTKRRTASLLSSSQSCIMLSHKRLSSWVRIAAKCKLEAVVVIILFRLNFWGLRKIDANVNYFDPNADSWRDICATTKVKPPIKTFLIFRFPLGTEPTGLVQLEPDWTTCICYTNDLHFYWHNSIMKYANLKAMRKKSWGCNCNNQFKASWQDTHWKFYLHLVPRNSWEWGRVKQKPVLATPLHHRPPQRQEIKIGRETELWR